MFDTFERDKAYLLDKFRKPVFASETGIDNEEIKAGIMALAEELGTLPHPVLKARAFEYITRNVRIDVNPNDWYVGFACWDRNDRLLNQLVAKWDGEVTARHQSLVKLFKDHNRAATTAMWKDYDHSVPDWDAVFSLGFPGLRSRARSYRAGRERNGSLTAEERAYFDGIDITYGAILEMLERFRAHALKHAAGDGRILAVARCLDTLIHGAPSNTFEVLQLVYLYFIFSEHIDRIQVRSMGNLDRTLYPYYLSDLNEKRFTESNIREFISYFLMQWVSINNYWGHPFYLGGTRADGKSEINELSYMILDEFDKLCIVSPKLQLKVSPNTPVAFIDKALDMIRRGNNSIVFVGEESMKRAMMGVGHTAEEARTCDITGCYEFAARGKSNGTIVGYLNMLKPIDLVFHNGLDPATGLEVGCKTGALESLKTFDDFHAAYIRQLGHIIDVNIRCSNDFEAHLNLINPSSVFSATMENSLTTAKDAFFNGCVYNTSAILNAGFATAVDALMAVKEWVFDKRELTLPEFREILKKDWAGHEQLRLKILRGKNKFGNGIDAVDLYAESIARYYAAKINLRPNARGGFHIASMHSARQFICLGEVTGATPDGRKAGDEISKNISPTMGMDVNGVTALIGSATRIDSAQFPGDFPLDVMMHPTTVDGSEGLAAMRGLLRVYMEKHGIAIHFNIFDADTLLDAQKNPEKYKGLQVRVCGWNARFNDLGTKEQDAYIRRARNLRE